MTLDQLFAALVIALPRGRGQQQALIQELERLRREYTCYLATNPVVRMEDRMLRVQHHEHLVMVEVPQ